MTRVRNIWLNIASNFSAVARFKRTMEVMEVMEVSGRTHKVKINNEQILMLRVLAANNVRKADTLLSIIRPTTGLKK